MPKLRGRPSSASSTHHDTERLFTQDTCQCMSSLLRVWGTTWRACHVPRNMPRNIDLPESSAARASQLISGQVLLNESNRAACTTVILFTLVSTCCLISHNFLGYHLQLNKLPQGLSRRQTSFCCFFRQQGLDWKCHQKPGKGRSGAIQMAEV